MDAPLNKINNISVEQGVFAKIFGYGKIVITTSSGLFNVPCVSNFDSFRMAAMEQIELYGDSKIEKNAEEIAKAINK